MITYIEGNFDREAQSGKYNHVIFNELSLISPNHEFFMWYRKDTGNYKYLSINISETTKTKYNWITLVELYDNTIQKYRESLAEFARDASYSHKILIQQPKDWELKKDSISLILSKHQHVTIIKCI